MEEFRVWSGYMVDGRFRYSSASTNELMKSMKQIYQKSIKVSTDYGYLKESPGCLVHGGNIASFWILHRPWQNRVVFKICADFTKRRISLLSRFVLLPALELLYYPEVNAHLYKRLGCLDVVQYMKDQYHTGKREVAVIKDCLIMEMLEVSLNIR